MLNRRIFGWVLAGAWLLCTHAASAESLKQAMSSFGILGVWADRCDSPPGDNNTLTTYSMIAGNRAQLRYHSGPKYEDTVYTITGARTEVDRLVLEGYTDAERINFTTVMRKAQGKIQVLSHEQSGKFFTQDGRFTADGTPAPWLERCR